MRVQWPSTLRPTVFVSRKGKPLGRRSLRRCSRTSRSYGRAVRSRAAAGSSTVHTSRNRRATVPHDAAQCCCGAPLRPGRAIWHRQVAIRLKLKSRRKNIPASLLVALAACTWCFDVPDIRGRRQRGEGWVDTISWADWWSSSWRWRWRPAGPTRWRRATCTRHVPRAIAGCCRAALHPEQRAHRGTR